MRPGRIGRTGRRQALETQRGRREPRPDVPPERRLGFCTVEEYPFDARMGAEERREVVGNDRLLVDIRVQAASARAGGEDIPYRDAGMLEGFLIDGLPYLVILKMAVNRGRDLGDLTTMLGWASDEALAQIREVVARYSPEDSADLESLIFIGKKEQETPSQAE